MSETYFNKSKQITNRPRVMLVEGPDDAYFIDSVLTDLGADPAHISICIARGKDRMESTLAAVLKSGDFTTGVIRKLALVVDADNSLASSLREISMSLQRLSEPVPVAGGFVNRSDGRTIGLFLFPDSKSSGDLETLCLASIPSGAIKKHAEDFVANAPNGNIDHLRKRQNQAYLAIASNPLCAGAGWASTRGIYDLNSAPMTDLRSFLTAFLS